MDILDRLINKTIFSRSTILSLVDDYTLFCYYLGQTIPFNQTILSPLRVTKADVLPSFVIFPGRNKEVMFFDHGTGESGSVFEFIKLLYGYNTAEEVYARIDLDFNLELNSTDPGLIGANK